jgi:predicted GIY-YIG superfamily endonuclease
VDVNPAFSPFLCNCRCTRQFHCTPWRVLKRFVYIIKSERTPTRYYTGVTSHPEMRLRSHNEGRCSHTSNGRPWRIDVVVEFADEHRALAFERYLKSGSGCAFARRHLR